MTTTPLSSLLEKFESGHSIPPVVLSNDDVVTVVNTLKKTHFLDLYEMRKEYIESVFFFENETGTIKIEQTRNIIEQSSKKSGSGYDIFIIERIDTLTLAAANSLLKLFEEVPSNILILLTSDSGREAMIETLASRVIFISSNTLHTSLNSSIREKIDAYFDAGDSAPFLSFLATSKLEKSEYLAILVALKDRVLSGDLRKPETIQKIESGIITLSSTNANPRWVVDEVALSL
jgi:DNA polymerase III delta prime subunit